MLAGVTGLGLVATLTSTCERAQLRVCSASLQCEFHAHGCEFEGTHAERKSHESRCPYRIIATQQSRLDALEAKVETYRRQNATFALLLARHARDGRLQSNEHVIALMAGVFDLAGESGVLLQQANQHRTHPINMSNGPGTLMSAAWLGGSMAAVKQLETWGCPVDTGDLLQTASRICEYCGLRALCLSAH